MAFVEFTDSSGVLWCVWDVPRRSEPPTREDLKYRSLCFQSDRGKRLLAESPTGWMSLSSAQLQTLCESAEPVVPRTPERPSLPVQRSSLENDAVA